MNDIFQKTVIGKKRSYTHVSESTADGCKRYRAVPMCVRESADRVINTYSLPA